MSTEVSVNVLKTFLANDLGIRKLDQNQAQKYIAYAHLYRPVKNCVNYAFCRANGWFDGKMWSFCTCIVEY